MMTCRELVELLLDYASGELAPERRAQVEQHLGRCPPCEAYLNSYHGVVRLARRLPPVPMPPEVAQRVYVAVIKAGGKELPPPAGRSGLPLPAPTEGANFRQSDC